MKYQLDLELFRRDIGEDRDERGTFDLLGAGDLDRCFTAEVARAGKADETDGLGKVALDGFEILFEKCFAWGCMIDAAKALRSIIVSSFAKAF